MYYDTPCGCLFCCNFYKKIIKIFEKPIDKIRTMFYNVTVRLIKKILYATIQKSDNHV